MAKSSRGGKNKGGGGGENRPIGEVRMHYGEYKDKYSGFQTVKGSYDKSTKEITVIFPKSEQGYARDMMATYLDKSGDLDLDGIIKNGKLIPEAERVVKAAAKKEKGYADALKIVQKAKGKEKIKYAKELVSYAYEFLQ